MSSSELDEEQDSPPVIEDLNISNDQFYRSDCNNCGFIQESPPKQISDRYTDSVLFNRLQIPRYGSKSIRHIMAAYDLWKPFFPTYLSAERFRNLHRPKLRHHNIRHQSCYNGKISKPLPVKNLTRTLYRSQVQLRKNVISAIESGLSREDIVNRFFRLRSAKQLTAKKDELYLFEYSEENPPVLSQIGMASNVKTYSSEQSKSRRLYYNRIKPGSKFQVIENNLYRAPIYQHKMPSCDFLIIRTKNSFYIRPILVIYTVGQTMPLVEVPSPKDSNILNFRLTLSNIYIHRFFLESITDPPSISLRQLEKLFPDYPPAALKRRLVSNGANYDPSSGSFTKGSSKYGNITLENLRKILSPERYCLCMSMLAARERLRHLNYTDTMINPIEGATVEAEVLAAPWNTSAALMGTLKGQSYLDLKKHLIDPTGSRNEGFSCVTWLKSPTEELYKTDKKLNIDPLANLADKSNILAKIRREKLERLAVFESEAQLIADIQARALSSDEVLSSDDESDADNLYEEDVSDLSFDQQLNDLGKLVIEGRTQRQLLFEKEEEERLNLLRGINSTVISPESITPSRNGSNDLNQTSGSLSPMENKVLKITRTYQTEGKSIERTEIVRDTRVIALYIEKKRAMNDLNISFDQSQIVNQSLNSNLHSPIPYGQSQSTPASRRNSLGPSELCRAEGTIVRISKKVLNARELRQLERSFTMQKQD